MITYLKLDSMPAIPTAHSAGSKKVLSSGHANFTRLTQVAWASLEPQEEIETHSHADMEESFFFTKGSGIIIINDQEFELSKGVFIIVPPTAKHFLKCTGDGLEFFYFGLQVYNESAEPLNQK